MAPLVLGLLLPFHHLSYLESHKKSQCLCLVRRMVSPSVHSTVHWFEPLTRRGLICSKRLSRQLHPGLEGSPPQPTLLPIIFCLPLCMPNLMILRCVLLIFCVPVGWPLLICLHFVAGDAKGSIWIFALSGALRRTLGKLQRSLKNRNHSKGECSRGEDMPSFSPPHYGD